MTEGWTSREISSSWCCSTRPIEHHSRAGNFFRQSCIYYDLQLEYLVICGCKYILWPAIKTFVCTNIWLIWVKNEFNCAEMQFYIIYKRIRIHIPHMINSRWEIFHPKPERQDALSHSKILNDLKIGHQRFDYQFSFMQLCLWHCLNKKIKHN